MGKKILLLGLILLIVAGVVVIALKGLNVSLMLRQHESITLYIGKDINYDEFFNMCKEVFGDQEFVLRRVELFGDSMNISVESITDEQKEKLAEKLNEKYEESYTADTIAVKTVPNVRIRDIIRPYIKPTIISGALVLAYMLIRFRKINAWQIVGKLMLEMILTEVALLSLIAIVRIPVSSVIINLMFVVAIIELVIYNIKTEKAYNK